MTIDAPAFELLREIERQRTVLVIELYPKRMRVDMHPDDLKDVIAVMGMPVVRTDTVPRGKPRVIALDTY